MGQFTVSLRNFADNTKGKIEYLIKDVVRELARNIDLRSPVGDASYWRSKPPKGYLGGHYRANNQYKFGSYPDGEIDLIDPTGLVTMARVMADIDSAPVYGLHYIANNVPYNIRIEEESWSRQAPQGVYGLAAADMQIIVDEELAKINAMPAVWRTGRRV